MKQSDFITAALDPDAPVPDGLVTPDGRPASKRFNVYRNNIVVSLRDALADGFPAVKSLVGDDFFNAMAGVYLRAAPPSEPMIPLYGAGFAEFISGFEPAQSLPYLADVAGLEYAIRESYHAEDSAPAAPEAFTDPSLFLKMVTLAAALRVLRSDYPISQIRAAALGGEQPTGGAEDILITRPEFDPIVTAFPAGTSSIIEALQNGATFGEAIELAPSQLDITKFIQTLLEGGAITDFRETHHA